MSLKSIVQIACAAILVLLSQTPVLAQNLPYYEVTPNGTWDCRDPQGT